MMAMGFPLYIRAQTASSTYSTPSSTIDCDSAWGSLEGNLPTPPPALSDAWNAAHMSSSNQYTYFTALSEICSFASAHIDNNDTSLSAMYSTFNLQYYSWYAASSESWKSLVTACPSTAVYGPVEEQTSELDGILTAYSSFAVAGCGQTAAEATATEGTRSSTSTPAVVTVNSGRREKEDSVVGIVAAVLGAILVV